MCIAKKDAVSEIQFSWGSISKYSCIFSSRNPRKQRAWATSKSQTDIHVKELMPTVLEEHIPMERRTHPTLIKRICYEKAVWNAFLKSHLMKQNVKHTFWIATHFKQLTVSEICNQRLPKIWDLRSEWPGSQPTKSALKREPEKNKNQLYYMNHFVSRLKGELSKPKCVYKCTYQHRCITSRIESGAFQSLDLQVGFQILLQQEFLYK